MARVYKVGGCVRDELLGIDATDVDWVVVGSTEQEMLANGFVRVGASFPVFLSPVNNEEYALARTERKTGTGYAGFEIFADPSVTLEDDLYRRDLTINAIAKDPETDEYIDPFGGIKDLKAGLIKHVSSAFAEDPVRVLRAARFAVKYDFTIDKDTLALMSVIAPELVFVSDDRILKELDKCPPDRVIQMLEILDSVGALQYGLLSVLFPASRPILYDPSLSLAQLIAVSSLSAHPKELEKRRLERSVKRLHRSLHTFVNSSSYELLSNEQRVVLLSDCRLLGKEQQFADEWLHCLRQTSKSDSYGAVFSDLEKIRAVDVRTVALESTPETVKSNVFYARVRALT